MWYLKLLLTVSPSLRMQRHTSPNLPCAWNHALFFFLWVLIESMASIEIPKKTALACNINGMPLNTILMYINMEGLRSSGESDATKVALKEKAAIVRVAAISRQIQYRGKLRKRCLHESIYVRIMRAQRIF